jgi:hypothetical protein
MAKIAPTKTGTSIWKRMKGYVTEPHNVADEFEFLLHCNASKQIGLEFSFSPKKRFRRK